MDLKSGKKQDQLYEIYEFSIHKTRKVTGKTQAFHRKVIKTRCQRGTKLSMLESIALSSLLTA